jgi:hypothetical protein
VLARVSFLLPPLPGEWLVSVGCPLIGGGGHVGQFCMILCRFLRALGRALGLVHWPLWRARWV